MPALDGLNNMAVTLPDTGTVSGLASNASGFVANAWDGAANLASSVLQGIASADVTTAAAVAGAAAAIGGAYFLAKKAFGGRGGGSPEGPENRQPSKWPGRAAKASVLGTAGSAAWKVVEVVATVAKYAAKALWAITGGAVMGGYRLAKRMVAGSDEKKPLANAETVPGRTAKAQPETPRAAVRAAQDLAPAYA
ncbi:MAG: hypothetical protein AB7H77_10085 [Bdellovibrionales bacterium]